MENMVKRSLIRISIIVAIITIMSFSDLTFAEDEEIKDLLWYVTYFVNVLSWLWVFLAKMA
jgi:hypothetical protein